MARSKPGVWPLQALNFFMADMQAGIGPFLGVFLLGHGWLSGPIGTVMTAGSIAGMLIAAPAGALVDATRYKRAMVVATGTCTVLASGLVLLSQNFWLVTVSQVATAIAGGAIGPAVNGITLGIVRQAGFNWQNGKNQAFNHAGNMVGAALSGFLGWRFGLPAVFWLAALFAVLSIVSVLMIPADAINRRAARGLAEEGADDEGLLGLGVLHRCKPLLILAIALAMFHLGNAAMMPLYGLAVVSAGRGEPASFVAKTIVVGQGVMILGSLTATILAERKGFWVVMLISFATLPIRGVVAAHVIADWGVYPVQILDGIGSGLQTAAVPVLVAQMLHGSGRVNVGQGAVMTVQGIGGAFSPAIGGWLAQTIGYYPTFMILGAFALGSIGLWVAFAGLLRPECERPLGHRSSPHAHVTARRTA
ncbi:Fucose permease [Enhydrobacter aerosaccus]|uniref:Fucose permease n=1 Tax=Enhydrobacter aerosaccus TaxID=225324 RepID=A0A1T4T3F4_9HYPH|nr:Fucose permease [Enhydrobacter aerosaccus]